MASDEASSSTSPSVDSYIGSVISLTSKSEIRYEGVLVSINPQESTIALQNVKSYGTEGRRKEGPQIPPSDKVYEYILFRGTDIKDLQVKSTPSIHPKQQTHDDPAIIQSHYALPPAIPAASAGGANLSSFSYNAVPQDMTRQPFPDTSFLYQTGPHLNSWTPSPAISNIDGPMQSQGYIGTSTGQPRVQHLFPLQYTEGYAPTSMPNPYNSSSLLSSDTTLASSLPSHVPTTLSLPSSNHESNNMRASLPQSSFLPVLANSSLNKSYPEPKDKGALLPSTANASSTVSAMPQKPLLPLPERGVKQFTDEFDFTAMNEKFNKDEVWGSLGAGDDPTRYNVEANDGYGQDSPNPGSNTVYKKDDFFDTLSCNSLNRGGWSGRTRLSERRKLDTETFGEFQQGPPMGRGNYGGSHSGYYRGSYNRGRGYGYYGGRGRGGGGGGYRPGY